MDCKKAPRSTQDFDVIDLGSTKPDSVNLHPANTLCGFLGLSLTALGVIYGDIGTSPLYAYSSIFTDSKGDFNEPSTDDAVGALSLLIWLILLVVCFKYIIFILMADNHGEGGTFALAGRLMDSSSSRVPPWMRRASLIAAMIGAALLIGDGMLTPAISVVSAIEGIQTYAPSISRDVIVIVSIIILFLLYMCQRFGTHRIGFVFGPVMIIWFLALAMLGIYNLVMYDATVFRAFNPAEAINYFVRNGFEGWASIGSAMLAVTGVETLYADLGHFGAKSVRFAWFVLPFPALLLNYIGQAAYVSRFASDAGSSFYASMPQQVLWPMIVLSTCATIIASQAVITGSFSLMRQAVNLNVCPRLSIYFTNKAVSGQIYVPFINYVLMIGTICLVAGFRTSAAMTSAYGLAISMIFVITTVLFAINAALIFEWRPEFWVPLVLFMFFMDGNMMGANLLKVPKGGWFPLTVAAVITAIFFVWKVGKERLVAKTKASEQNVSLLKSVLQVDGNIVRPQIPTFFLCNSDDVEAVPHVLTAYLARTMTLPQPSLFCHVKIDAVRPFCQDGIAARSASAAAAAAASDAAAASAAAAAAAQNPDGCSGANHPPRRFEYTCIDRDLGLHRLTVNFGFAERTNGFFDMVTKHAAELGFKGPDELLVAGQSHVVAAEGSSLPHRLLVSGYDTLQMFNRPLFQNLGIPAQNNLTVVDDVIL